MEHVPVSKSENQTDKPFDFSKYTQPEVTEIPTGAPTGEPFDFSEYLTPEEKANSLVDTSTEAPADGVFDLSQYTNGQEAPKTFQEVGEEISAEAELTKRYDFSDENNPVLRDATPEEIYNQGKLDARKKKFGSGIVRKLFHRS